MQMEISLVHVTIEALREQFLMLCNVIDDVLTSLSGIWLRFDTPTGMMLTQKQCTFLMMTPSIEFLFPGTGPANG
jgi:hypothetical protein